ncbi:hypothetical protein L195_g050486 [Trifolium pratense]|uniref:Uncharacterized protein n=1 Tax=Trifolium pratense TaxID=57577 RepID=A0A2K3JU86_TRIPR|nr:hypothetical protein L195_g050486 [Trifolium pratense]
MYNMQVLACMDELVLKVDQLLMVGPLVSSCKSYGLLWHLQTIVPDETHEVEIDVEACSQGSASSAKDVGSTQGGLQGQATDLI